MSSTLTGGFVTVASILCLKNIIYIQLIYNSKYIYKGDVIAALIMFKDNLFFYG